MSRFRRPRVELEERLVTEYMATHHRGAHHMIRVRLGALPPEQRALTEMGFPHAIYGVVRHWADALAIYETTVHLIEAKIKLRADALGQILLYDRLFEETPELSEHAGKARVLEVIYVQGDPDVERLLKDNQVHPIRFAPTWAVEAYLRRARRIPD